MRAEATIECAEPEALALRMRKHFGHKVEVEVDGPVTRIRIPVGEFELEPRDRTLEIRAAAESESGLARVQEVVGSHLARFARKEELDLRWRGESLEERAVADLVSEGPVVQDSAPARRMRRQANEGRASDNTR
jgi:hypothetical protein